MASNTDIPAVRRSLRLYLMVGVILFCGTIATVAVATVPWLDIGERGFDRADMILGLMIAATKATLVAAIFMHLNHEKRLIYLLIGIAGMHCIGMAAFTLFAEMDGIHNRFFYDERGVANRPVFGTSNGQGPRSIAE